MTDTIFLADRLIDGIHPEPRTDVAVVVRRDTIVDVVPGPAVGLGPGRGPGGGGSRPDPHAGPDRLPHPPGLPHVPDAPADRPGLHRADHHPGRRHRRAPDQARLHHGPGRGLPGAASLSVGRAIREGRRRGPRVLSGGPHDHHHGWHRRLLSPVDPEHRRPGQGGGRDPGDPGRGAPPGQDGGHPRQAGPQRQRAQRLLLHLDDHHVPGGGVGGGGRGAPAPAPGGLPLRGGERRRSTPPGLGPTPSSTAPGLPRRRRT